MRVRPFFCSDAAAEKAAREAAVRAARAWVANKQGTAQQCAYSWGKARKARQTCTYITPGEYVPYSSVMHQHKTRRIVRFGFTGGRNHETKFQTVDCRAMEN